jgi:hypothetical protein
MRRSDSTIPGSLPTLGGLAMLVLALGCAGTEPRRYGPVVVLPQVYVFGGCLAKWSPATPPAERTVVDFHFGTAGNGPTDEQVAPVVAAGGVVVHRFNVPILRAEIDVDAVPTLVLSGRDDDAYFAVTVPEPDRRKLLLLVMLSHDLTDADIAAVEALGGQVRSRWDYVEGYAVEIEDAQVPRLRSLPGVKSVSANGVVCLYD